MDMWVGATEGEKPRLQWGQYTLLVVLLVMPLLSLYVLPVLVRLAREDPHYSSRSGQERK